jgi:hypothetical protein
MATTPGGRTTGRWPLLVAVLVPLALGTIVVLGAGFGILSACTDTYSCPTTGCAPCRPASTWLNGGWAVQGVLLVAGLVLAVLARGGRKNSWPRAAGLAIAGLSVVTAAGTTALAIASY